MSRKIVVNKSFQQRYLSKWAHHLIKHENDYVYIGKTNRSYYYSWNDLRYSDYYNNYGTYLPIWSKMSEMGPFHGVDDTYVNWNSNVEVGDSSNYNYNGPQIIKDSYLNQDNGFVKTSYVSPIQLVNHTFLDILDRVNTAIIDGKIWDYSVGNKAEYGDLGSTNILPFFNALLSRYTNDRDSALQWLVDITLITAEERQRVIDVCTGITDFSFTDMNISLVENESNVWQVDMPNVCRLQEPYRQENNTTSEPIYIVIFNYETEQFSNSIVSEYINFRMNTRDSHNFVEDSSYSISYKPFTDYYSRTKARTFPQLTYTAFRMGLEGTGSDIEFDKLEKIDYIDDFKIKFELPKEIIG